MLCDCGSTDILIIANVNFVRKERRCITYFLSRFAFTQRVYVQAKKPIRQSLDNLCPPIEVDFCNICAPSYIFKIVSRPADKGPYS